MCIILQGIDGAARRDNARSAAHKAAALKRSDAMPSCRATVSCRGVGRARCSSLAFSAPRLTRDLSKDGVLPVAVVCAVQGDEELGAVGVALVLQGRSEGSRAGWCVCMGGEKKRRGPRRLGPSAVTSAPPPPLRWRHDAGRHGRCQQGGKSGRIIGHDQQQAFGTWLAQATRPRWLNLRRE